ncbi:MAG: methyltransferase [Bacilli bacterium]|jgi:16S rRNA (guanine1207-N2)-methyltransferase|nr:methyltransferase [Bacilli bacterium]MDD3121400.1 methyltransferase [Bacilli bacterium]MDY0363562.1 methyltransferase [Bacilli bacterium]
MSHYFINDKNIESEDIIIKYTYKGKELSFISNSGIFSKNRVDFGTNLLLNTIEIKKNSILDLGCGYGVVGVCIASSSSLSDVLSVDINERAVELTNKNYINNQVNNGRAIVSDVYCNLDKMFDVIITNPPIRAGKEVVYEMVLNGINYLKEEGEIWVVIRKDKGGMSLFKNMQTVYSFAEIVNKKNQYLVIKGIK